MGKREAIGLIYTIILFTVACIVGKVVSDGSWISFNAPVIGILVVGEICWWLVSRKIWRE